MSALERYEPRQDSIERWAPSLELAKAIANTEGFVPKAYRNNPPAIAAAILYGREIGLGAMLALQNVAVIDGKVSLSAVAMRGLILAAGHELHVEEATITRVTLAGRRKDSELISTVTWTMDDAKRANLAGKDNWRRYPRQMLMARATGDLARAIFADVIGGLYVTEEIEDGDVIESVQDHEPPKTQRRRRTLAPVSTVPESGPPHSAAGTALDDAAAPSDTSAAGDEQPGEGRAVAPEAPPAAPLMTDAQRPKLMALFNESGMSQRPVRLAFATVMIGRKIESANELTVDEASKLIDVLERRNANIAAQAIGEDELLQQLRDTLDAQERPAE